MTPAQLAAIRERVEKATPEPWTCKNRVGYVFSQSPDADCVVANCGDFADKELVRFNGDRWNADATFIAAARRDVPDLLNEVDRLRACLAMIAGTIEEEGDGTTLAKCQAVAIGALEGVSAPAGEVERLERALVLLVGDVDALIRQSEGVVGLHLNGDLARWEDLTEGGRHEEWLLSLETARAALEGK